MKRPQTLQGKLERVKGIEPSYSAWKAAALPLSYTRAHQTSHGPSRKARALDGHAWLPVRQWWRGLDLNQRRHSQRIYSPPPLTTRAPLRTAAGAMHRGIHAEQPPRQPLNEAPYGGAAQNCQPQERAKTLRNSSVVIAARGMQCRALPL